MLAMVQQQYIYYLTTLLDLTKPLPIMIDHCAALDRKYGESIFEIDEVTEPHSANL